MVTYELQLVNLLLFICLNAYPSLLILTSLYDVEDRCQWPLNSKDHDCSGKGKRGTSKRISPTFPSLAQSRESAYQQDAPVELHYLPANLHLDFRFLGWPSPLFLRIFGPVQKNEWFPSIYSNEIYFYFIYERYISI